MNCLTAKGEFALELIHQGLHPTFKEVDVLWANAQEEVQTRTCPTCHGVGKVTA